MAFDEKFLDRVQEQLRAAEEVPTDPAEFDEAAIEYVREQGGIAARAATEKNMSWDVYVIGSRPRNPKSRFSIPRESWVGGWSLDLQRTWTNTGGYRHDKDGFIESGTVLMPNGAVSGFELYMNAPVITATEGRQIPEADLIPVDPERALTDLASFVARNQLAPELIQVHEA